MSSSFSFPGAALAYLLLCWRSVERSLTIFFPFISEAGALSLRWNSLVSLQIFHPSPLRRANELGETCNRDSPSSRFYFVTANSLVRLALSAPAYYQVDFVFSASLAGELAPVCVVLPLLVVFPWLWVYLENPIPRNSKSRLVLRPILPLPPVTEQPSHNGGTSDPDRARAGAGRSTGSFVRACIKVVLKSFKHSNRLL